MTAWRDMSDGASEIRYTAPPEVRAVIESLGRTEDVRFSPDGRRLAVAAFNRNRIAVFDIDASRSAAGVGIALTGVVEISSPALKRPHGVDFIDAETLVVANREGDVVLFVVPPRGVAGGCRELTPIHALTAGDAAILDAPGSVRVTGGSGRGRAILVCNNAAHAVTRHALDAGNRPVGRGDVVAQKWLDVPDSIGASDDGRWIAVSSHNTHAVLLYEDTASWTPAGDPVGLLRGVHYPHGLRFSADGGHIFLADAGAPYVQVYANDGHGWHGLHDPVASVRVMDDELFHRGRTSPQDGGPKGLDIHPATGLLVVTSECQPMTFFDLSAILEGVARDAGPSRHRQQMLQVRRALEIAAQSRQAQLHAEAKAARARAKLAAVKASLSWRLTKPLRWLHAAIKGSS